MATAVHLYSDDDLLPYTDCQYKVVVTNNVVEAPSSWLAPVRSGEVKLERVPEGHFRDIQARSSRVVMDDLYVISGTSTSFCAAVRHVTLSKRLFKWNVHVLDLCNLFQFFNEIGVFELI